MSGSARRQVKTDPNLTPILDMVFQLITFFVLIFNCKQAETARGVELPVVGSARPVKFDVDTKVIVFNCKFEDAKPGQAEAPKSTHQPQIWVMGQLISEDDLTAFVAAEAQSSMLAQGITEDDIKMNGKELKDIIIIRADAEIPFRMVNSVVAACQNKGYRQFAFKSKGPKESGNP
ncbi:MAG: biopolymer transporter ExbD [Thermoguttaceae bacterium]|jgi:biopolymer transport protein ExbD